MKQIILSVALLAASCIGSPALVPIEGPVGRSVERVLERHDAYVQADPELDELDRAIYLESTDRLRGVLGAANPDL